MNPPTALDTVAPTAPSHLRVITTSARSGGARAMAAGVTGFRAVWDKASDDKGVTSYEVYANGKRLGSVRGTDFSFSRLQQRKKYAVWVVALDEAGNRSARSNTVRFNTDPAAPAPAAPTDVSYWAATTTAFMVGWKHDWAGVDHFEVTISNEKLGFSRMQESRSDLEEYFEGLRPGTTYDVSVVAVGTDGQTSAAGTGTAKTLDGVVPPVDDEDPVVTGITVVARETELAVSWKATDNIAVTSYTVALSTGQTFTTNAGVLTHTFRNLTPDTSYTVTVTATDAAGNSGSRTASKRTLPAHPPVDTPPTAPTGLHVTSTSATTLGVGWNASTDDHGVDHYLVQAVAGSQSHFVVSQGLTATLAGLTPGTPYTITVTAIDTAGQPSAASPSVSGATDDLPAPTVTWSWHSNGQSPHKYVRIDVTGASPENPALVRIALPGLGPNFVGVALPPGCHVVAGSFNQKVDCSFTTNGSHDVDVNAPRGWTYTPGDIVVTQDGQQIPES